MNRAEIESYLRRDWRSVAAAKSAHWAERKSRGSFGELFAVVSRLRQAIVARRPEWPTASDRAADLEAHRALSERLRRVDGQPSR
ncbi:MAG TPA: hypothetical protein VGC00_00280 [Thermoanaerobaculia bacterium]